MIYYFTAQEGKNYTVLGLLIFVNFFFFGVEFSPTYPASSIYY